MMLTSVYIPPLSLAVSLNDCSAFLKMLCMKNYTALVESWTLKY